MAQTPRGMTNWLSTSLAAPVSITGITNAIPAVVTAPGHGAIAGDVVYLKTNWGRMSDRAFEVLSVSGDTLTLLNANTTNPEFYPAGGGVGSLQKVVAWTQVTKVTGITSNGGEPKTVDYFYLENETDFRLNDGFSAVSYNLTLDTDADTSAGWQLAETLTETGRTTVYRMRLKNGKRLYLPVDVALNQTPSITDGQIVTNQMALNGKNRPVAYAAI